MTGRQITWVGEPHCLDCHGSDISSDVVGEWFCRSCLPDVEVRPIPAAELSGDPF